MTEESRALAESNAGIGVPPTPAQVEVASVYTQLCAPSRRLYITAQTATFCTDAYR